MAADERHMDMDEAWVAEFVKRRAACRARTEALEAAVDKGRRIQSGLDLLTVIMIAVFAAAVWSDPTVQHAIGAAFIVFLVRWSMNIAVKLGYVEPELRRIDMEFPSPPPWSEP